MCQSAGTTREHSPPKCLFPESVDLEDHADLRKNLMTVPSCADHNPRLSRDDEYFLVIATSNLEGNSRRDEQFGSKVIRALSRSPAFIRTAYAGARPATIDGQPTMSFTVDRQRVERVIEKIARGIYYHHTQGRKLFAPLQVFLPTLRYPDGSLQQGVSEIGHRLQAWQGPWLGDNPEVFSYRLEVDSKKRGFVQMSFYEGFAALAIWSSIADQVAG